MIRDCIPRSRFSDMAERTFVPREATACLSSLNETTERGLGAEDTVVGRMDVPGRWAGGFRAWDEQGVYLATGRGAIGGRVLRVPADVLSEKVDAWFPFGRHLIQGLYRTARSIEATARPRESLVALGTLAAGFAHEVNNPAAAASRSVDALDDACQTLLSSLSLASP